MGAGREGAAKDEGQLEGSAREEQREEGRRGGKERGEERRRRNESTHVAYAMSSLGVGTPLALARSSTLPMMGSSSHGLPPSMSRSMLGLKLYELSCDSSASSPEAGNPYPAPLLSTGDVQGVSAGVSGMPPGAFAKEAARGVRRW